MALGQAMDWPGEQEWTIGSEEQRRRVGSSRTQQVNAGKPRAKKSSMGIWWWWVGGEKARAGRSDGGRARCLRSACRCADADVSGRDLSGERQLARPNNRNRNGDVCM